MSLSYVVVTSYYAVRYTSLYIVTTSLYIVLSSLQAPVVQLYDKREDILFWMPAYYFWFSSSNSSFDQLWKICLQKNMRQCILIKIYVSNVSKDDLNQLMQELNEELPCCSEILYNLSFIAKETNSILFLFKSII